MALDRIQIGEKIGISFVESDKFKTNHISVNFIGPLEREKASKNALLTKVLKRGSKNYPTMAELNRALDFLYSAKIGSGVYKIGEAQVVGVSASMLDDKYALDGCGIMDKTIDILGDIVFNPLTEGCEFKKEYVDGEKINLINEIDAQINNKNAYAQQRCTEIMCNGEKFAVNRLGDKEDVEKIDGKTLYEHYQEVVSSYTAEIFCVGRFEDGGKKNLIIEKLKELFAPIVRGNFKVSETEVIKKTDNKGEFVEKMAVNQGKLAIGFRLGASNRDEGFENFVLFNSLYGASPTSKLFENVREKLSLCYYCSSSVEASKGLLYVMSGIEVENKEKAISEIMNQLEEVKKGEFTDKELEDARIGVIGAYKGIYDDAGSIEFWYMRRLLSGIIRTPEEFIDNIKKVTREKVSEAAKSLSLDTVFFLEGTIKEQESLKEDGADD